MWDFEEFEKDIEEFKSKELHDMITSGELGSTHDSSKDGKLRLLNSINIDGRQYTILKHDTGNPHNDVYLIVRKYEPSLEDDYTYEVVYHWWQKASPARYGGPLHKRARAYDPKPKYPDEIEQVIDRHNKEMAMLGGQTLPKGSRPR